MSAFQRGGWDHYGWGQDRHMIADLYDAMKFNTEATGHWSKPPNLPDWPRPTSKPVESEQPKPKRSLREMYASITQSGR